MGVLKIMKRRKILILTLIFCIYVLFFTLNSLYIFKARKENYGDLKDSLTNNACQPKTNLMFLKVHKAGSSTIYNVMLRFALKNHLNVVIPNKPKHTTKYNYLGDGKNLTTDMILPIPKGEQYNILTNHVVYNRTFFNTILPSDTFYFAIIRNPQDRFVSAAFYYGLVKGLVKKNPKVNMTNFIFSEFLKNPKIFGFSEHIKNHMAHDFGVSKNQFENITFLQEYTEQVLDRDFNLVMLMEFFDESLVLLRRFLCWNIKDLLYFKLNAHGHQKQFVFSEEDRLRLRQFQVADEIIYEHFRKKFWREMSLQDVDIYDEINIFKRVRSRMDSFCSTYSKLVYKEVHIEASKWHKAFNITINDCKSIKTSELKLLNVATNMTINHYNTNIRVKK